MEDKLTSSSDIGLLFANFLKNILSDNCNLLKNLIFLLRIASDGMALVRIWSNCAFDQTRCVSIILSFCTI